MKSEPNSGTRKEPQENRVSKDLAVGSIIDEKYELLELLGNGASGVVYKARHLLLEEDVAIKFLNQSVLASEQGIRRFQNEAAVLSSLDHPNIVKLKSFGTSSSGRLYMTLEFLQGKILSQILSNEGTLKEERALQLFLDISKGMSFAHERNIIHRDIKPGNIMIVSNDEEELAKILDFGIFKDLGENQKLTQTGSFMGSANYMSPEQCKNQGVDARSDIYSLGCLMYEAMAGEPPMLADTDLLIMSEHLHKKIDHVPAKYGVSKELQAAIIKCLNKDPNTRYQQITDLIADLERARQKPQVISRKREYSAAACKVAAGLFAIMCIFSIASTYTHDTQLATRKQFKQKYKNNRMPECGHDSLKSLDNFQDWLENQNRPPKLLALGVTGEAICRNRAGLAEPSPYFDKIEQLLHREIDKGVEGSKRILGSLTDLSNADFVIMKSLAVLYMIDGREKKNEIESTRILEKLKPSKQEVKQSYLHEFVGGLSFIAEIEQSKGDYPKAIEYSKQAAGYFAPNVASNERANALAKQGVCLHLLGRDDEARRKLIEAIKDYERAFDEFSPQRLTDRVKILEDLKSYVQAIPGALIDCVKCLNDLKTADPVIELLGNSNKYYRAFSSSYAGAEVEDPNKIAELSRELGRAFFLKGDLTKASKCLKESLTRYMDRAPYDDASTEDRSYELEGMYLRVMHAEKRKPSEIREEVNRYLKQLKEKVPDQNRHLVALAYMIYVMQKLHLYDSQTRALVDSWLSEPEKEKEIPIECMQVRYEQGSAELKINDGKRAWACFNKALKDCQWEPEKKNGTDLDENEDDSNGNQVTVQKQSEGERRRQPDLSTRALLLAILARQMETCVLLNEYSRLEKLHEKSLSLIDHRYSTTPLEYFNKNKYFKALFESRMDIKTPIKRHHRLLMKDKIQLVDDYPSCAINLAEEYIATDKEAGAEKARQSLLLALEKLKASRPSYYFGITRILEKLCQVCKLTGQERLLSVFSNELGETRKKLSSIDNDDPSWEPYTRWARD